MNSYSRPISIGWSDRIIVTENTKKRRLNVQNHYVPDSMQYLFTDPWEQWAKAHDDYDDWTLDIKKETLHAFTLGCQAQIQHGNDEYSNEVLDEMSHEVLQDHGIAISELTIDAFQHGFAEMSYSLNA